LSIVCTHASKQILFLDFLRSLRKRADRGKFWPSPKSVFGHPVVQLSHYICSGIIAADLAFID